MNEIRMLPTQEIRVETGPTQFGDDWPGTFIRGDNAFHYALAVHKAIEELKANDELGGLLVIAALSSLLNDLQSSDISPSEEL